MHEEARKPENRGYADNGDAVLKQAAARYMERVCGVKGINPETEVLHSIGSKAALSILPAALINPGDYVLMTTPGYPVFGTHAKYYGGLVHNLPLTERKQFSARPDSIPADVLEKAKVLVINYPNNPTGASATPEFFAQGRGVREEAQHRRHPRRRLCRAGVRRQAAQLSRHPGAKEVGIELHSTSKTFNMTGWRCGFVAGNELLVKAYGDVKDNTDSGQFLAIQHAVGVLLRSSGNYGEDRGQIFAAHGLRWSMFSTRRVRREKAEGLVFPLRQSAESRRQERRRAIEFKNAEEVSQWLITEKLISTVPWDDAGAYLRFSVTFSRRTRQMNSVC